MGLIDKKNILPKADSDSQIELELGCGSRKKRSSHARVPIAMPQKLNECWSMDFISDRLDNGQQFRTLVSN